MGKRERDQAIVEAWLGGEHNVRRISRSLDLSVTVVKRVLVRSQLVVSTDLRYQQAAKPEIWTRPCSKCGSEKPRPKHLFYCYRCRANILANADHLPESFLWD